MPSIKRALSIEGWMAECELNWLATQASTRHRILEVGSWKGRSTRAMADNLPVGGVLYAVDTWKGQLTQEVHQKEITAHEEGWLLAEFKRNLSGLNNVVTIQMTSLEAANKFRGESFDMIFIDGSHDYEDVKADILAWLPLLSPGGVFCGHDYTWSAHVARAVNECIAQHRIAAESIWVMEA